MKIINFTFSEDSLIVYFDVEFKQINYVKMESNGYSNHGVLECEEMEIKYSKKKNLLKLFTNNTNDTNNIIILLITVFDNKDVCYSYYINRLDNNKPDANNHLDTNNNSDTNNNENTMSNMDLMARGFTKLFKNEGEFHMNEDKPTPLSLSIFPIKNQNIFANIKKKV